MREAIDGLRADGGLEVQPTFFEVTTAVAFELFRRAGVEIAVLEVGLGGRLDATNVVNPPELLATAITSIAFDHQLYLGASLREIALEKAGIIKPGVPVVVGPLEPDAAAAIDDVAASRGAVVIRASAGDCDGMTIGLAGVHQRANAAVAVRVLQIVDARGIAVPAHAIAAGLADPQWPGRLDRRRLADGRELLLDAAHNPAGAASLASYLTDEGGDPRPLVFAAMRDKDVARHVRRAVAGRRAAHHHSRVERAFGRSGIAGSTGARDRAGAADRDRAAARRRARHRVARVAAHRRRRIDFPPRRRAEDHRRDVIPFEDPRGVSGC